MKESDPEKNTISLDSFLYDLEMELKRVADQITAATPSAMKVNWSAPPHPRRNNRPVCRNGVHNPETSHSPEVCNQLHPERAVAYH